jgi:hypothetical protein
VTLPGCGSDDIVKDMKTSLLVPLGLTVIGMLAGCGNEPSSSPLTSPSPGEPPPCVAPQCVPQFPAPQPGTAPAPVLLGGQTGSGSAPVRMTCEAADGGASHGVVVEATIDLRSSCAALIEGAYRKLMPDLESAGSECVAAATLDSSLAAAAPVCRCSFEFEDPQSDAQYRMGASFAIGLERSRTLLGKPAGGCEAAGPFQSRGSAGSNEACAFTSEEFGGCSLDAAATSCDSTCATLRARQAELAARAKNRYEPLGDECHSTHDIDDCYGACVGSFRLGSHCYRGVVSRYDDVFRNLEGVDCEAPLAESLAPRETDLLSYLPFCTVHTNVSGPVETATFDAGLDAGESR